MKNFWLYTAVDPASNDLLLTELQPTTNKYLAQTFLDQLREKRAYAVLHHYIEQIWQNQRNYLSDKLTEFATSGRIPEGILNNFTEEYTGAEIEGIVRHTIKQIGKVSDSSGVKLTVEQLVESAESSTKGY